MALALVSETLDQVGFSSRLVSSVPENEVDLALLASVLASQSPKMGRQIFNASSTSSPSAMGEPSVPGSGRESGAADLQLHLQAMFAFLEPHHILKEVVKLESTHVGRLRYLAVVACAGHKETEEEETCILGFDCVTDKTTLGLVIRLYADTYVTLDGDGGFSLCTSRSQHIFKPVSVHTLWAVLQSLHKASNRAQKYNHFTGGSTHRWAEYYERRIDSDRSCLNEWHQLPDVESRRPPSPDQLLKPREKAETERLIRSTLKEVMMVLDLDVVTSKDIRKKVEDDLSLDLTSYKSFIDEEMLIILGQMDGASQVFEHVYLGSEWNAANLEELQRNGVGHILNVTREIDNFFPGQFDYLNIRVYDDEATELLKHWDRTFKFIARAVDSGSKVLVHCKMGVSRSASVVVAYAMKAYDWDLQKALQHVKLRRSCVKPNASFMEQLKIYAGILDASRQRHNKLWRSKSESNLKHETRGTNAVDSATPPAAATVPQNSPTSVSRQPSLPSVTIPSTAAIVSETNGSSAPVSPVHTSATAAVLLSPMTHPITESPASDKSFSVLNGGVVHQVQLPIHSSMDGCGHGSVNADSVDVNRPKSWSPDDSVAGSLFPPTPMATEGEDCRDSGGHDPDGVQQSNRAVGVSLRVPCGNGRTYSVSQNRAVQLEFSPPPPPPPMPPFPVGGGDERISTQLLPLTACDLLEEEAFSLEKEGPGNGSDWIDHSMDLLECINTALLLNVWPSDSAPAPPNHTNSLPRVGSVKDRIYELEAAATVQASNPNVWRSAQALACSQPSSDPLRPDRTGLVLNLASQFETVASPTVNSSPECDATGCSSSGTPSIETCSLNWTGSPLTNEAEGPVVSQVKSAPARHQAVLVRLQDEKPQMMTEDSGKQMAKRSDPFSAQVDRVFDKEERSKASSTRDLPHRQHSWGAAESRSTRDGSGFPYMTNTTDLPPSNIVGSSVGWMTSYASDPSLATAPDSAPHSFPCDSSGLASAISLLEFPSALCLPEPEAAVCKPSPTDPQPMADNQSTSPPPGVVRMQLEALENQQRNQKATTRLRRSLPEEVNTSVATAAPTKNKGGTQLQHTNSSTSLNRSVSETAAAVSGGSVSRLRKELEAKAILPLTGSVAPHPSVMAAVESSHGVKSARSPLTALRKRSLSVDKMNYRGISSSRTGSTSESAGSPSPPPLPRRPTTPQTMAHVACSTADGEIDADLNVKLLVEQFETPRLELRQRGFSESSVVSQNNSSAASSSSCSSSTSSSSSSVSSSSRPSSVPPTLPVPQPRQAISGPRVTGTVNVLMPTTATMTTAICTSAERPLSVVVANPVASKPPVPISYDQQPPLPPIAAPRHNRKLHGKTHPLDRLAPRQRHAHPVFGTM